MHRKAVNQTTSSASKGFTLIEVMITTGIAMLVLAGLTSSYIFLVKSSIGMGNYVDMNMQSRYGLEVFGRDIRTASGISNISTTGLTLTVPVGGSDQTITYAFDSIHNRLNRTLNSVTIPVLYDVNTLEFKYYNLLGNATTNIVEAKKVQLEVQMIRNVLHIENTNNVISARYMMRNRKVVN